jgi:hypothetical protein
MQTKWITKPCHQEPLQRLGETYTLFLNTRITVWHAAMLETFRKCSVFHQHYIIVPDEKDKKVKIM